LSGTTKGAVIPYTSTVSTDYIDF